MIRRLLIIAYYFPPIGGIGAIRMARFTELLPEFGWEPTVLAPRDTPHAPDPRLHTSEDRVIRSRSFELSRLGRAIPQGTSASADGGGPSIRGTLRSLAHRFVFYPDAQVGWYPDAVRRGARALSAGNFDAIYSSSNPMTAHLVARRLHRRSGLPWVAEFRDPWSDRLPADHPWRRHASNLERRVAVEADRVLTASPAWAAELGARWGRDLDALLNGHDDSTRPPVPPEAPTITHLGTYYPGRQDLRALFAAIRQLHRDTESGTPRVRFVGDATPELDREIADFGLEGVVEVTGFLPHDAAMAAMRRSSILVVSGFSEDVPMSRGWIPAKVYEYLASGLPILYFGRPEDDAWQLLAGEPGCHLVPANDAAGTLSAIRAGLTSGPVQRDLARHSRRTRTKQLAAILDQLPDGGPRPL